MKSLTLLFTILFSNFLIACNDKIDPAGSGSKTSFIQKCWTSSYEEATSTDQQVFRPCDYKEFPISHYRLRFELQPNHVASYLFLSPADAHHMVPGTWNYNESSKTLIIKDSTGMNAHNFKVIALAEDKLVVKGN